MVTPHLPWKFHANRSSRFLVMLLTKKQRNRPKTIPLPPTGGEVNYQNQIKLLQMCYSDCQNYSYCVYHTIVRLWDLLQLASPKVANIWLLLQADSGHTEWFAWLSWSWVKSWRIMASHTDGRPRPIGWRRRWRLCVVTSIRASSGIR